MSFTSYLKFKNLLCHDENVHVDEKRDIYCSTCQNHILNISKHLTLELDSLLSCQIAQYYANWSGDIHVPCKIKITNIPGIMPSEIIVTYSILLNVIKLLEFVNQEFIHQKNKHFETTMSLQNKILDSFLKYVKLTDSLSFEECDENTQEALKMALSQLSGIFKEKNIFDCYLNELCPYVKSCVQFTPEVKENITTSPGEYFLILSNDATKIRNFFSRFSINFDTVFIMIYNYLCQSNTDLLINFTFDFISRVCKGYFDENNVYMDFTNKILNSCVSYKQNTHLYYLIQHIRKGEVVEHLSQDLLKNYSELRQLIWNEFEKCISAPNNTILQYAFLQSFPFVLFPNGPNYYAFTLTLLYLTQKLNFKTLSFEKGSIASAQKIFNFIEKNMNKISNFQKEGTPVLCWNKDTLDMYMSVDKNLIQNATDIVKLIKTKKDDKNVMEPSSSLMEPSTSF